MSLSFCIITDGKRREMLENVINSIRRQQIPEYEIIIAGVYHAKDGICYVPSQEAAAQGRLGELRNVAVAAARYENIVLLDDDILLAPDWFIAFKHYDGAFDILTSRIRLPDGGRYYDHATACGPRGQAVLDVGETDPYVYMTGGGGWVMKNYVARSVRWDEERTFNQKEDVSFSRCCQAAGYKISHYPQQLVYHADATYTNVGRIVMRRQEGRSHGWILEEFSNRSVLGIIIWVLQLQRRGLGAEANDVIRLAVSRGRMKWLFSVIERIIVFRWGGEVSGSSWSPYGLPEYNQLLNDCRLHGGK